MNRKNEIDFEYGPLVGIKKDGTRVVILSEDMLGDDLKIDNKGKLTLNAEKAIEKLSLVNRPPGAGGGLGELFFEYMLVDKTESGLSSLFTEPKPLDNNLKAFEDSLLSKAMADGTYWVWTSFEMIEKVGLEIINGVIVQILK